MKDCMKNDCPTTDAEKQGPKSPGADQNFAQFTGHKKDGDPKPTSDGKGHWSGH